MRERGLLCGTQRRMPSLLTFAIESARDAGALLLGRFEGALAVSTKSSAIDLVTDADQAAEALIVEKIREKFPEHAILAEEGGASGPAIAAGGASLRWVIDPLDGTVNFAHGLPHFCVSIAAVDGEGARVGVIHDPIRGETFFASRGDGAWLEGPRGPHRRLQVSGCAALGQALLATGFSYQRATTREDNLAEFNALLPSIQGIRRAGSAALDLAYVAAGRLDGYWEDHLKPWDTAAGGLLVEEAGGLLKGLDGGLWDPWRADVVAAGPLLHGALLARLMAARGARDRARALEGPQDKR